MLTELSARLTPSEVGTPNTSTEKDSKAIAKPPQSSKPPSQVFDVKAPARPSEEPKNSVTKVLDSGKGGSMLDELAMRFAAQETQPTMKQEPSVSAQKRQEPSASAQKRQEPAPSASKRNVAADMLDSQTLAKKKQELIKFYLYNDPEIAQVENVVDDLLSKYTITDITEMLLTKYRLAPIGWMS
jgi:hypothetical protein